MKPAESIRRPELPNRTRSEPQKSKKRPLPDDKADKEDKAVARDTFAFRNRTRALDTLKSLERDVNKRRLGITMVDMLFLWNDEGDILMVR
ncbi:Zinc finger RanBP2-type [Penicillium atrosanguineum]|nr:Zinc finger RanBP2-type [Penicillium atrosanguineum]